jgi:hypothetical protein
MIYITAAVYPVFVKQPVIRDNQPNTSVVPPAHWRRTHQDVTQLKAQLEDLKNVKLIFITYISPVYVSLSKGITGTHVSPVLSRCQRAGDCSN